MKLNKLYCSVFGVPLCEHRKRKLTWTELFDEDKTVWGGVEDQHRYTADIGVWEKGRVKQRLFSKNMFSTCQNDTSLVQWRQVQESNKSVVNQFLNPLWWNHQSKTCTSQRTLDSCIKVVIVTRPCHYVCVTEAKQSYLCFIVSGFRYNVHPLESSFTWFCSS